MTELNQIYKCNHCGIMVEIIHAGKGSLICCGEKMELITPKREDVGTEKHLPVMERTPEGLLVKVGSIPHPMEEKHYIEWIEIIADNKVYRKYLNPKDKPEALFCIEAESVEIREYCNIHGLWQT